MTLPPTNAFRHLLEILPTDIDELGHVNNVVYLRWVQEASARHWEELADEETRKNFAWVVLRHEIDYNYPADQNDSIHVLTWVGQTEGVRSQRHVNIYNASNRLLASACTTWCMIDAHSGKPRKIEDKVLKMLLNSGVIVNHS